MRGGLLYSFSENFKFINSIFQKQRGKLLLRNFPLNFWDFFYSPFCVDDKDFLNWENCGFH